MKEEGSGGHRVRAVCQYDAVRRFQLLHDRASQCKQMPGRQVFGVHRERRVVLDEDLRVMRDMDGAEQILAGPFAGLIVVIGAYSGNRSSKGNVFDNRLAIRRARDFDIEFVGRVIN